jgi:hypothetical protein
MIVHEQLLPLVSFVKYSMSKKIVAIALQEDAVD